MDQAIKERIENDIKNNKVFIYMKGTPDMPQCGFSAQSAGILQSYNIPFASFNVLEDEEIRQGIKEFSEWPTIPQIFIDGEFIGGCDILMEMHASGDLAKALGVNA
ncbi:MAG: Grx4 family monothiol glutaredoxin [Candidatus Omnitrophica bacterium]|nr:Grx4 family monothiol glutaredoxin [Candidatus Omnitrophota bacterium]